MEDNILEQNKLNHIIKEYEEYITNTKLKYENVFKFHTDYEQAVEEQLLLGKKLNILNKNINKPYFARIDFSNLNDNLLDTCYIGKVGLTNYDNEVIVVDWRAPIAAIYYDSNIGTTHYKVDDKIIEGELLLKRQYNIEDKKLISFSDVDTVSNDEILKPYLGVSADQRLKNIVSTIQSEQNTIIRSSISNNLIIQGVAGSGKTTVALHRIAYLVYNYRDIIKNNQYMVIGPNKFFINYISSVLPDLDVNDVMQFDLTEFAVLYLKQNIELLDGYSKYSKVKSKLEFKTVIDNYVNNIALIDGDIKIKDFVLIPKDIIIKTLKVVEEKEYDYLMAKIDRVVLLLNKYLDDNKTLITRNVNDYYDNKVDNNIDLIRKERSFILDKIKTSNNQLIKNYFNKKIKNIIVIYNEILKNNFSYHNKLYYEDITPLLYLNYKIYGSLGYDNIKHVVIDEAQDYNELTFYTLKKILSKSTFSIYGDLAQSLYPERSINNWEEISNKVFKNITISYLTKSYRTSIEIMNEANKINEYLNLPTAVAVIRHSDPVDYYKIKDKYKDIEFNLNKLLNKKLGSIALIVKEEIDVNSLYDHLKDKYDINKITIDKQEYKAGISIVTSKLSKGLEFDGVIIIDGSEDIYNSNNSLDLKLLYVSMTRAMHNLIIMYSNNLVKVLDI